jgi:hypothetical protein
MLLVGLVDCTPARSQLQLGTTDRATEVRK